MIDTGVIHVAEAVRSGAMTALEVVDAALRRIDERNPVVVAFLETDAERALEAAQATDDARNRGVTLPPLAGVPVGVKANIAVEGLEWTAGIAARAGHRATVDASVVRSLCDAGAIVLGTTNLPEAALGAITANPFYGTTRNPHEPAYHAGGSSGGSAAAIADRMASAALGTDTMGSVRIPAGWCGLVGWKPTPGVVSTDGLVALSDRLDTIGLLTGSVADLRLTAQAISGVPRDSGIDIANCRIAVAPTLVADAAPDIADAFQHAISQSDLAVSHVELPFSPAGVRRAGLLEVEVGGYSTHRDDLEANPEGFSDHVRKMLLYSTTASTQQLARAYRILDDVAHDMAALFTRVDVLLLPTSPVACLRAEEPDDARIGDFTAFVNAAGACAVSLPAGLDGNGLPVGLQVVMASGRDADLFAIAASIEERLGITDA